MEEEIEKIVPPEPPPGFKELAEEWRKVTDFPADVVDELLGRDKDG